MSRLALAVALVVLTMPAASARRTDDGKHVRVGKSLDAVAKICRETAYRNIQGKGRDKYISLYFDECLKRGGPF